MTTKNEISSQEAPLKPSAGALERLMPPRHDACTVLLAISPDDYSASHIARAVEDSDAHLVNLNVTSEVTPDGRALVELRATHTHPRAVVRSLERYGYEVMSATAADDGSGTPAADEDRLRALETVRYINI